MIVSDEYWSLFDVTINDILKGHITGSIVFIDANLESKNADN